MSEGGRPPGLCQCRYTDEGKRIRCERHTLRETIHPRPIYYSMKPEDILAIGEGWKDQTARAILFLGYVADPRINELTDFVPGRLEDQGDRYTIRLKTLKQRGEDAQRKIPIPRGAVARCLENKMMPPVVEFLGGFKPTDHPFRVWQNMSEYIARQPRITVEARIKLANGEWVDRTIEKPMHPHLLRHFRATHLADYYDMDALQLCAFFGWKNIQMALRYTKGRDLWRGFTRGVCAKCGGVA